MAMVIPKTEDVLDELKGAIDKRFNNRTDCARELGMTSSYLSEILSGKKPLARLPIETGRRLAELSGISLSRLAGVPCQEKAPPLSAEGGEAQ